LTLRSASVRRSFAGRGVPLRYRHVMPQNAADAAECAGWLNGSLGTFNDPALLQMGIKAMPGGFTSQFQQDKMLWQHLFRNSRGASFRYADVAANHFKRLSNTYFFDRCLGWTGVCVEANPIYFAGLQANRSCHVVPHCVSNSTDEVDFVGGDSVMGVYGGISGVGMFSDWRRSERPSFRLHCILTQTAFDRSRVKHLHFLSLDVEGHEASVLAGIDFNRMRIDNILCEGQCDRVLPSLGYVRTRHVVSTEWLWEFRDDRRTTRYGGSRGYPAGRSGGTPPVPVPARARSSAFTPTPPCAHHMLAACAELSSRRRSSRWSSL